MALQQDQPVAGLIHQRHTPAGQNRRFLGAEMGTTVGDPHVHVALAGHLIHRMHGPGQPEMVFVEVRVKVGIPVKHVRDVFQVLLVLLGNVFHQEVPADGHVICQGLEHGKDVAGNLGLIGAEATRRVKNPCRHIPTRPKLQFVGHG